MEEFLLRILKTTSFDHCGDLFWRTDGPYAPISIWADCSDTFWWATSDNEKITFGNLPVFEQSYMDCSDHGSTLFACRMRKMRPMDAYYKYIEENVWHLFDACGPERTAADGNVGKRK